MSFVLGAICVVYGDIGTSPLYTLRQCFVVEHPVALTTANVFGILSIIFWAPLVLRSCAAGSPRPADLESRP